MASLPDTIAFESQARIESAPREEPDALRLWRALCLIPNWFAYHRILELQSVALAAEKILDDGVLRVSRLCEVTGCGRKDAEWAAARATSPDRSHALDDAMARAREEGFEIPPAESEIAAFSRLRRFVRRHRLLRQPDPPKTPARPGRRRSTIST